MTIVDERADYWSMLGEGVSCAWIPGRKYSMRWRVHDQINSEAIAYELSRFGFSRAKVRQLPDESRELELLGPDSPEEFVLRYDPVRASPDHPGGHDDIDDLTVTIVKWIWDRAEYVADQLSLKEA